MNLANRITVVRILLTPVFVLSVFYYRAEGLYRYIPAAVFFAAMITDAADGAVARAFKQRTELGTILDPIADKILILTAFLSISLIKGLPLEIRPPIWVPVLVVTRDALIIFGSLLIYIIKQDIRIMPSRTGKITTFLQMLAVLCILLQWDYSRYVWNLMAVFTAVSGVYYIRLGSAMLSDNNKILSKNPGRKA
jgi:CDP-diacylglycerol--glycerol-3-phosphate 3-phosphatidyltransferase